MHVWCVQCSNLHNRVLLGRDRWGEDRGRTWTKNRARMGKVAAARVRATVHWTSRRYLRKSLHMMHSLFLQNGNAKPKTVSRIESHYPHPTELLCNSTEARCTGKIGDRTPGWRGFPAELGRGARDPPGAMPPARGVCAAGAELTEAVAGAGVSRGITTVWIAITGGISADSFSAWLLLLPGMFSSSSSYHRKHKRVSHMSTGLFSEQVHHIARLPLE